MSNDEFLSALLAKTVRNMANDLHGLKANLTERILSPEEVLPLKISLECNALFTLLSGWACHQYHSAGKDEAYDRMSAFAEGFNETMKSCAPTMGVKLVVMRPKESKEA